jgi:hypothetical protein
LQKEEEEGGGGAGAGEGRGSPFAAGNRVVRPLCIWAAQPYCRCTPRPQGEHAPPALLRVPANLRPTAGNAVEGLGALQGAHPLCCAQTLRLHKERVQYHATPSPGGERVATGSAGPPGAGVGARKGGPETHNSKMAAHGRIAARTPQSLLRSHCGLSGPLHDVTHGGSRPVPDEHQRAPHGAHGAEGCS